MATVKFTYKQDVDTVFAFVSDPEVSKQRSIDMGERDIKVTKEGEAVTNIRTVDAEVPGFAAKLLKPSNTVVEVKRWSSATKSGQLSVDVKGAPTQIDGTIKLTPSGSGCDYTLDFKVTCKIPLIGGKLASYVEGITKKGMQEEFEWNQRKLNERAG
jgi:hypothetical protein